MPKKIIVIDDDIAHSERLISELRQNSYTVCHYASDEQDLFNRIRPEPSEIVLLDRNASRIADITAYLKQQHLPFIYLGNENDNSNSKITSIYRLGALGLLLKPVRIQQLIVEIETALHWHREKMQLNRRKENIDSTIANNRKISTAIGIIMERYRICGHDSFEIIRITARNKQFRIVDIAERIILTCENSDATATTGYDDPKKTNRGNLYLGRIQREIQQLFT